MAVHFLIHLRLSLRCAPASAGQRIYRRLPQGALFSPVGLPRRPAALAQGAGVPDAEDLGRPFATAAWRGEARSSHCWRKVGVCVCDENYLCRLCFLFESKVCLLTHFTLSTKRSDKPNQSLIYISNVFERLEETILIITANIIIYC